LARYFGRDKMVYSSDRRIVGSEIGDINRKIKENMKKYLDGDLDAKKEMFLYARKRQEILGRKRNG
jgi:hypothetical protein